MRKHKCRMTFLGRETCNCELDHGSVLVWRCFRCFNTITVDADMWWETSVIARLERMLAP